jgi:hypothetical protein
MRNESGHFEKSKGEILSSRSAARAVLRPYPSDRRHLHFSAVFYALIYGRVYSW